MYSEVIIAACSLLGTLLGTIAGHRLTLYRIEQLEKKVERHNNFAARLPVVEEQIKVINHRLRDLEGGE